MIRPVLLLEIEPLIIYALKTLFKEQYRFQAFNNLTDLMVAARSQATGSYFCFVNISCISSEELSAAFSPEDEIIDYSMFYANVMNSKILAERIQYLFSIRAKVLTLEASPQMLRYAASCLEDSIQFYCSKVTEFLLKRVERGEQTRALLSVRESQVLKALAQGKGSKQIADELNIGTRTIEAHRQNIMKKLKTNNVAQCIQEANRLKLIE